MIPLVPMKTATKSRLSLFDYPRQEKRTKGSSNSLEKRHGRTEHRRKKMVQPPVRWTRRRAVEHSAEDYLVSSFASEDPARRALHSYLTNEVSIHPKKWQQKDRHSWIHAAVRCMYTPRPANNGQPEDQCASYGDAPPMYVSPATAGSAVFLELLRNIAS